MKIPVSHGHLEAALREPQGDPRGGAVLCHPHPLHGGTMHTKAVFRTAQALAEVGVLVVRFNFRGVGTSTGSFDEGVGEQDDLRGALTWLEERNPELPLLAGGFSFGSRVALSVGVEDPRVVGMVALGIPVDLYDYGFLSGTTKPVLVVQGEEDELGPGSRVAEVVEALGGHVTLARIPGANHYFDDRFDELQEAVHDFFTSGPGATLLKERPGES